MSATIAPIGKNDLTKSLQRAIGFTLEDLGENREGKLGSFQKLRLTDRLGPVIGATILSFFIWLILWLIYASVIRKLPAGEALYEVAIRIIQPSVIWNGYEIYGQFSKAPMVYSGAAISVVLLMIGGICALPWRLIRDMSSGAVFMTYGRVEIEQGENKKRGTPDGIVRYYYRLRDDERFEVTRQAHDAIDSGGLYAVYYLPRSRVVVAVEPRMDTARMPVPLSEGPLPALGLYSSQNPH